MFNVFKKSRKRVLVNEAGKKRKSKLRENIETIFSAIVIALVIRILLIEAYEIPTGSMIPTIVERDRLLVNKFIYGVRVPILGWKLPKFTSPDRGDIVVFHYPKYKSPGWGYELVDLVTFGIFKLTNTHSHPKNYIKRAIGLPGDVISFKNEVLQIDGKKVLLSKKISPELMDDIKGIVNPQANSIPYYGSSGTSYYYYSKEANSNVGMGNELLRSTKIGNTEHVVQISGFSSDDIPFLYIPKGGDRVEFSLFGGMVNVKVNGKLSGKLSMHHFDKYYGNIVEGDLESNRVITYLFKDNYYFMMGDNRDTSEDSRSWGFVNEKYIIGKPLIIFWPINRFGVSPS